MHRDLVLAQITPHLTPRPLGERVELHDGAVVVVDLDLPDVRARRPLVAAQAGDPRLEPVELQRQRLHLAHVAAEETVLDRVEEEVGAPALDEPANVLGIRLEQLEVEPRIALAQRLGERKRLLRQASGVDREHAHGGVDRIGHVDQHRAVDLERRRDGDALAELVERPLEQRVRLLALEADGELARVELVEENGHAATRFRAGSRPARAPRSSSPSRRWKSVNVSPSLRVSSQPRTRPSTADSSRSLGTRRKSDPPIAGAGPSEPRTNMSYADTRLPSSSFPVVAWKPRSPTQCCAHACGQPSRWSRRSAISSPNVRSRWATRTRRRSFVSPTEKLQCGSPVHAIEFAQTSFVVTARPSAASSSSVASTWETPVTMRFCCRVSLMSPPNDSTRSATAISWSPDESPSGTGTPM